MVELPGAIAAAGSAGLADKLVGFGFVFEVVKGFLDGAFDFVAEFAGFVLGEAFDGHSYQLSVSLGGLISYSLKGVVQIIVFWFLLFENFG
jgi:hypothetical protein